MNRIVSGKIGLDVQRVMPIAVVEAALDSIRPTADAKTLHLRVTLDPDAGPHRLPPVWNLLSNAVMLAPKRGASTWCSGARATAS